MIDELEIEHWINNNCKVDYTEGCALLIGRNFYGLGVLKINSIETVKEFFSRGGRFYVYRDATGRILESENGIVTMKCCRVDANRRYIFKNKQNGGK